MKRLWMIMAAVMVLCTACGDAPAAPTAAVPATTESAATTSAATTAVTTTAEPTTTTTAATTTTTTTIPTTIDPTTRVVYVGDTSGQIATDFELPLCGATGFASIDTTVYADLQRTTETVTLVPGDAFTVLESIDTVWQIRLGDGTEGYLDNTYCYLNIADVIPSVVLDNTNSYASAFLSSGKEIPSITGEMLYNAKAYNPRLGREEFLVACNWRMVQKIYVAQQAALAAGYTLVINEAFRPNDVQQQVAAALKALSDADTEVKAGINTAPWNISWFIAQRISTHQMGCAIDTSLAKVTEITYRRSGEYRYQQVTGYTPCSMPTPIHELSAAAVALATPINSGDLTGWRKIAAAKNMTEDALRLQTFCTDAGMTPLASEWWHFNDLETKAIIGDHVTADGFRLDTCLSEIP